MSVRFIHVFICFNNLFFQLLCHCCCSVNKSCPTVCNPMDCSTPGFPVLYHLPEFAQTHICWVSNATQPSWVICHPFLLLSSIFPRIRVLSNKSSSRIRWPKYWSFSFNMSPFNEYSGLISFRIDWFDLSMSFFSTQLSLWSNSHIHTWPLEKP